MKIIKLKNQNQKEVIKIAANVLAKGGLLIYPTETCYGAGVDATNSNAVVKLLQYKGRRQGKAISIAVADKKMAENYVEINSTAQNLYQNFLPGPLTVISKSLGRVSPLLESQNKNLGIRIPDYPFMLQLIKVFAKPITSTSANTSDKSPPYSIPGFLKYTSLKAQKLIDLILDAGKLPYHPPSSVVDTTLNELKVLRQGEIVINKWALISSCENQTKNIAKKIFNEYKKELKDKSLVFALQGELGSGKTQFVKGLALALAIKTNIPSPTFILMREYPYQANKLSGTLYHIDTWRMQTGQELIDLGIKKMASPGNIIAIEWLEKVKSILEEIENKNNRVKVIWITIDYINKVKRKIKYK